MVVEQRPFTNRAVTVERPGSAPATLLSQSQGDKEHTPYKRYDIHSYLALETTRRPRFWTNAGDPKRREICLGLNALPADHEAVMQARELDAGRWGLQPAVPSTEGGMVEPC